MLAASQRNTELPFEIYKSTNFLSFPTVECNDSGFCLLFFLVFLLSFFFVKDQIASFHLKQIVVVLSAVCVFISLHELTSMAFPF